MSEKSAEKLLRENNEKMEQLLALLGNMGVPGAVQMPTPYAADVMAVAAGSTMYHLTQLQDYLGNIIYPHTSASVTWMADGGNAESVLAKAKELLANITGVSGATNLDDATKLATLDAIFELNKQLSTLNKNLGEVVLSTEGSGADTKYYAQIGADTASKKLLGVKGNIKIMLTGNTSNTYIVPEDGLYLFVSFTLGVPYPIYLNDKSLGGTLGENGLAYAGVSMEEKAHYVYVYVKKLKKGDKLSTTTPAASINVIEIE